MALSLDLNKPLAVVGVILGGIISLLLLAALLPQMFSATQDITEAFENGTTGNESADTILTVFAFVVPIVIVVAIVGLVIAAVRFSRGR
jgi:hypothetical protein